MVRYILRSLWRSPGFSAAVILVLSLGIGANAAVFSAVNAILLRPLPYHAAEEIFSIRERSPLADNSPLSPNQILALQDEAQSWAEVGAFDLLSFHLQTSDRAERLPGAAVSPGFFGMLGVPPHLGRTFKDAEGIPGGKPVAMISHQLWQTRFVGEDILGREVELAWNASFGPPRNLEERFTIVGVLPEAFLPPFAAPEIYVPWIPPQTDQERDYNYLFAFARIRGLDQEAAQAQVGSLLAALPPRAGLSEEEQRQLGATLWPVGSRQVDRVATALWVLLAAVGLLLLAACANVANLLLARNAARRSEIDLQLALGAGRGRLLGWLLAESLVLAGLGAAGGLALAYGGVRFLQALQPSFLPRLSWISVDGRVLAFTLGVALGISLLFGCQPALRASRKKLFQRDRLRAGRSPWRGSLVVAQVGLAVVLLVGASLLVRSFRSLMAVDLGFDTEQVVTFEVHLPPGRYPDPEAQERFHRAGREAVAALPGVASVALATGLPMSGVNSVTRFQILGREATQQPPGSAFRGVSDGFFKTLGIPLLAGRSFRAHEAEDEEPVIVISQRLAELHFGDVSPLGRRLNLLDLNLPRVTVIGVAGDVPYLRPDREVEPMIYLAGPSVASMGYAARLDAPGGVHAADLQRAVAAVDPAQPIHNMRTFRSSRDRRLGRPQALSSLMSVFAVLALLVSVLGVGSVQSLAVRTRRAEIGVRTALGATPSQVVSLFLRRGLALVGLGIFAGVAAAVALGSLLAGLLYGIEATDPRAFGVAALAALRSLASPPGYRSGEPSPSIQRRSCDKSDREATSSLPRPGIIQAWSPRTAGVAPPSPLALTSPEHPHAFFRRRLQGQLPRDQQRPFPG